MSYPVKVILSKRWEHITTGRTASVYGACPASGRPGDTHNDWKIKEVGWTVENSDGTIGIGRMPWTNKKDAEQYLQKFGRH